MSTKNKQGELWGTAPNDWALYLEITFIPLYKKVISKLNMAPQSHVLDIGCGSGLFLRMANVNGAIITGIDVSPELLVIARERNPLAELLNQDMENLSFSDNSFDMVTGFNSFQYAEDISKTLKEIKRVLKDDGKLAIGVWGSAEECEALEVLASIASLLPHRRVVPVLLPFRKKEKWKNCLTLKDLKYWKKKQLKGIGIFLR